MDEKEYCLNCGKTVIPEGKLNAQGLSNACPNCGEETIQIKRKYSRAELALAYWESLEEEELND